MTKPTVYLETTLIGHLAGRMHPDSIVAARQTITRDWWDHAASNFQLVASLLVAEECGEGDPEAATERLAFLEKVDFLEISDASRQLAENLIYAAAIPKSEPRDAQENCKVRN